MNKKDDKYLDELRHSSAHLLAAAVLELYPDAKPTIGPAIENGFYYDFDNLEIKEEDLEKIEKTMSALVKDWNKFTKKNVSLSDVKKIFKENTYKVELATEFSKEGKQLTVFRSGDFTDLCRGGHIENPAKELKHFKLLSIAGAYWRGDEKNKMLTRIYGTAWPSKKELDDYLKIREEAEVNNHRVIGKELELFEIIPEIGQGLPVWLPNGYIMRREIEDFMIDLERRHDYKHVLTPHISKSDLFKISGHLDFYKDAMYSGIEIDEEVYYLKPMNCPAAMMIFNRKTRSYRDLPLRLGELGTVYRYEKSGELHGLQRVRGFTQNDAHIFCAKDQLVDEIVRVLKLMKIFYKAVGFENVKYVLALSDDKDPKFKKAGTAEGWHWAESTLRGVLQKEGVEFEEKLGDAAFYGPKIDVLAVNVFGKSDAVSTVQIDFNLPERFKVTFVNNKGEDEQPVVVHRALVGSFERFFAFLIEHHKGNFPVWFAPLQVKVLPISDKHLSYCSEVVEHLKNLGIRVELDEKSETLQAKIREAQVKKVPYMIIVGDKEVKESKVSLRTRDGQSKNALSLDKLVGLIQNKIETKALDLI